jgi:hypothetical protein
VPLGVDGLPELVRGGQLGAGGEAHGFQAGGGDERDGGGRRGPAGGGPLPPAGDGGGAAGPLARPGERGGLPDPAGTGRGDGLRGPLPLGALLLAFPVTLTVAVAFLTVRAGQALQRGVAGGLGFLRLRLDAGDPGLRLLAGVREGVDPGQDLRSDRVIAGADGLAFRHGGVDDGGQLLRGEVVEGGGDLLPGQGLLTLGHVEEGQRRRVGALLAVRDQGAETAGGVGQGADGGGGLDVHGSPPGVGQWGAVRAD